MRQFGNVASVSQERIWQLSFRFVQFGIKELFRSGKGFNLPETSAMISVEKEYPHDALVNHSLAFALSILSFCDELDAMKRYAISRQLLRSGTSIAAQVEETQSAERKTDFIHKLKIAEKGAREAWQWLYLCCHADGFPCRKEIAARLSEIQRILNAILKSGK